MSWLDPLRVHEEVTPVRVFVFLNDKGDSHHIEATSVVDAWVSLSFAEEREVEDLVEDGWRLAVQFA